MTDFYTAPVLRDDNRPGEVLGVREIEISALVGSARACQVVYVSADSRTEPIPASGTVITPRTSGSGTLAPLLVYCPSFHGLGGECAPSQQLVAGEEALDPIVVALDRGWTVAIPDGENLGITGRGTHTFLAARAAGHTTLDIARTLPHLSERTTTTGPVVMWGYADGGRAALWAAGLHHDYAPEIDLRGIAAGAPVTDPAALVPVIDGGPWSALGLAGLLGLSRAYHHLPLRHVFTVDGHRIIARAEALSAHVLLTQYRQPLGHWCETSDPWNDPIWRYVLARENMTGLGDLHVPVHLYHGLNDSIIPRELSIRLADQLRNRGSVLTWQEYDADHFATAALSVVDVVDQLSVFVARHAEKDTDAPTVPRHPDHRRRRGE